MKRENAFKGFLLKSKKPIKYVSHCKNIEKAFGNMDMDEIISTHQNITKVRKNLEKIYTNKSCVDDYMVGLNWYLKFSASSTTLTITGGHKTSKPPQYHVARGKGVELTPDVAFAAQVLEQEYTGVIQFAEKILVRGIFDYIPVIISDEIPVRDGPEEEPKVLGRFFAGQKPYIEIYYKNIKSNKAAVLRNCLAHEYLHYLHYIYAGAEFSNASKELTEALADFFCVLYSIHRHSKDDLTRARSQYRAWKKFEGCWPYAFALYFYTVCGNEMKFSTDYSQYEKHGSIGKFVQIFFSTTHPAAALDALLKA
jgi:hypothetical protein